MTLTALKRPALPAHSPCHSFTVPFHAGNQCVFCNCHSSLLHVSPKEEESVCNDSMTPISSGNNYSTHWRIHSSSHLRQLIKFVYICIWFRYCAIMLYIYYNNYVSTILSCILCTIYCIYRAMYILSLHAWNCNCMHVIIYFNICYFCMMIIIIWLINAQNL